MSEQLQSITGSNVNIRPFQRKDIAPLVEYLTGNSEEFWRQRGVDKSKLKSREECIAAYEKSFVDKGEVPTLATILLVNHAVGVHGITELIIGDSAVFHAHIWSDENRRRGIGLYSYLKAAEFFFDKFNLKKLVFKTPKLNHAPNRLKEKIGIPAIGETLFDWPTLISPLPSILYELDRELLKALKIKHGV